MFRMRRLGRFAAVVGLATTASLVGATGANASIVDPRIVAVVEAVSWTPAQVINERIADYILKGTTGMTEAEILAGSALAAKIGTPAEVQAGQKLGARACRTGWGCFATAAAVIGLGAYATSDTWGPWVQGLLNPEGDEAAPIRPYDSANTQIVKVLENVATPVDAGGDPGNSNGLTFTHRTINLIDTGFGPARSDLPVTVAADCHRNGEWVHTSQTITLSNQAVGNVVTQRVEVCSVSGVTRYKADGWEVRRIHFSQTGPFDAVTLGIDKGFYWGADEAPTAGDVESLTRCQRPDGSVYDVVVTEPVASGLSAVPACNPGDTPVYVQTTHIAPDGTRTPQSAQRLDDGTIGNAEYPACASAGCTWTVKVNGFPCTDGNASCVEWSKDKNNATCWYGPYQLALRDCYWLERAYENGVTVPATVPNTDGNPATWDGPEPQLQPTTAPSPTTTVTTTTAPSPTTSPTATASPSTDPSPRPSPTPTSTATASPEPSPVPSLEPGGSGQPNPDDTAGQRCFPSGWSVFNPVQWVYMPVMCALRDAFQPDPALTTQRAQSIRADLETRGPGPVVAAVGDVFNSIPTSGGCSGPTWNVSIGGHTFALQLLNACDEPMATAATWSRRILTVVLVVSGGFVVVHALGSAFGLNVSIGRRGGASDGE